MISFQSELEMSEKFEEFLLNKNKNFFLKELKGINGIPDYVYLYYGNNDTLKIISIELKLKNWKRAVIQAFKYKSFSHLSYVVIDKHFSKIAISKLEEFKKYNIGLATFDINSNFEIISHPIIDEPYSGQLYNKIEKYIYKENIEIDNMMNFAFDFI
ncbi:MAG TPA: hypothetical protein PK816_12550 [Candidatus Cloacimonadota bacterium]|nr:hypothetical protein [Candidatus Cloacimonadota bacterium]